MDAVAGVRTLSAREEEMLGLLAGFPDDGEGGSSRELSFSDLVDAGARPTSAHRHDTAPAAERDDQGSAVSPGKQEVTAASKQQRLEQAAAREKRQRRQRSGGGGGSRGSCGGGGDGVLLNFYVPGLLTRSMTAPRPGRGALPHGAPGKAAAAAAVSAGPGKARTRAPLGIGCWPALWGRSRDHRSTAKVCS